MDTRNGDLYVTAEAARAAGVPEEAIEQVVVLALWDEKREVRIITSGPFKGRRYERDEHGNFVRVDSQGATFGKRKRQR